MDLAPIKPARASLTGPWRQIERPQLTQEDR